MLQHGPTVEDVAGSSDESTSKLHTKPTTADYTIKTESPSDVDSTVLPYTVTLPMLPENYLRFV